MVTADAFLFWFLAFVTLSSALGVLFFTNPIHSVFSLIMTMIGISALFASLGAYFISGVQLIVYAGAVLVLFVMVLMLFNLKTEKQVFSKGHLTGFFKLVSTGLIAGLVLAVAFLSHQPTQKYFMQSPEDFGMASTKKLGELLFTKYMIVFQVLGVLLLVVAVGSVALARSKGGTHEQPYVD
jgi:NADH-quinone oxidoreductase subunit J